MSHDAKLIQNILSEIKKDYPETLYTFLIEKALPETRMYPDIQVLDSEQRVCCAVEIGYTRPEKLSAYRRELKIPDVRWYDKKGNLHADVQEKSVRVSVEIEPQTLFVGYFLMDEIDCYSDECVQSALMEGAGIDLDQYADWRDAIEDVFKDADALNAYYEYLSYYTALTVITDFVRVWFHFFCDKCGESEWVSKNSDCALEVIAYDLEDLDGREFARAHDRRQFEGGWKDAVRFAEEHTGTAIRYQDGEFISKASAKQFHHAVHAVRVRAMAAASS